MATRNSLNNYEVSIIKALIATKKFSNQEIAGLINRSRGPATKDISTGRISNIKNDEIRKYKSVPPASKQELTQFLDTEASKTQISSDPISDLELSKIIKPRRDSPDQLDITETDRVECKKSFNIPMKTLAAFANNKGGYLLFGVENMTWQVHGIDVKKFMEYDLNKLNQNILSTLGVGLEIQKKAVQFAGKTIGIIYVSPAQIKPIIMTQAGDGFSQGHIYYRYPGEDRFITQFDLQRLLEQRIRQISETVLSKHIANILKYGIENSAIMDLSTGLVDGKAGAFMINPDILPDLKFIKEGEFVETSGAPTLKLIGELSPANVVITKTKKLTEMYPYSYRDLAKKVKSIASNATDKMISDFIKKHNLKMNPEFSAYNFRNKKQEDKFTECGMIPIATPSLYNESAVTYISSQIGS